ncbi:MAG: helix-turn-helix domain-containing protein [Spirochaetaceae bacterium]|jgi:transcriptional regulator with XRE-family HTH domain|nr:helix-turn-helix domain-containing protein [Spirochaetaceae bacterium]
MDEHEICRIFGSNIRKYRKQHRWSQDLLAEKIDVSATFLSNVENGKAWISPKTVAKLSDVFNIGPYELFKPELVLSEDITSLIKKYTEEIRGELQFSLNHSLDNIYLAYCKS